MTILLNNNLPEWIKSYAQLGGEITLNENDFSSEDYIWRLLAKCCPNIYEKYIIILHPFWINFNLKELNLKNIYPSEDDDFKRVNHSKFFNIHNKIFNLKSANLTANKIWDENKWGTQFNDWPDYLSYPSEGNTEAEELDLISSCINRLYGNIETDFYYVLLKNENWSDSSDKIFRGNILDINNINQFTKTINGSPSAIYPTNNSNWCITSNYDLPFTFMGGKSDLIDEILSKKDDNFDIYEIQQRFTVKRANG